MPFDAAPSPEVIARDRVVRLRDFLDALPDERFNIYAAFSKAGLICDMESVEKNECGTAACISGWAQILYRSSREEDCPIGELLGLTEFQVEKLFTPPGWFESPERYTRKMAVAVLDHYLATGEISWDVAT